MHLLVFVLVPSTAPSLEAAVSRLMEGGSRDFDVYQVPCSCVGEVASAESWRQVDGSPEGVKWLRELKLARARQDETAEREILRRRYRRARSIERAHSQYGRVNEDCEMCQGRAVNTVSRDPAQHYDWWVLGGRWAGLFGSLGGNAGNVARLEDVPVQICPAAVVTPEGDWYESRATRASAVEFRATTDVPEEELSALVEWKRVFEAFAWRYRGHLAVVVDCHS